MTVAAHVVCQGLVKIYKVADLETVALQGLDLEVQSGEMLAIVGNSGSGKSTLLNIIGGLDRPSAGRVVVGGHDLLEISERGLARYRREGVGFVWQQSARNLMPYLTAIENVQLPAMLLGRASRRQRHSAVELLEMVGLAARANHYPAQLSGGEQQRVAIAVAMVNRPQLLLADEPTGEVDSGNARTIYGIFRRLCEQQGCTVVIVTHDRQIASEVDRVVAVRDGRVSTELTRRDASVDDEQAKPRVEELIVLDAAGRLQLPSEIMARSGLRDRVRVEVRDDQVVILPGRDLAPEDK